jgi:hypothetical protein
VLTVNRPQQAASTIAIQNASVKELKKQSIAWSMKMVAITKRNQTNVIPLYHFCHEADKYILIQPTSNPLGRLDKTMRQLQNLKEEANPPTTLSLSINCLIESNSLHDR